MMKTKQLIFILPICLLMSAAYGQETNKQKFKKLEWLVGKWMRTNPKTGQSGYETWAKVTDFKLSGNGITLKGKKVLFVENLEFVLKGNDIFYTVMIPGDKQPTYFKLTALSSYGFTCENPQHDFPKKITYKRDGKHVKAVISGNGQSIDYHFVATPSANSSKKDKS